VEEEMKRMKEEKKEQIYCSAGIVIE